MSVIRRSSRQNVLATFAEFEADLIRLRTCEHGDRTCAGKLKGEQPKPVRTAAGELRRMHNTGERSISDVAELFSVSRRTVYRVLARQQLTNHR